MKRTKTKNASTMLVLRQSFKSFVVDRYNEEGVNNPFYYERITDLIRDMPQWTEWVKGNQWRRLQACALVINENKEQMRYVLFSVSHPGTFDKYTDTDPLKQTVFPHTQI